MLWAIGLRAQRLVAVDSDFQRLAILRTFTSAARPRGVHRTALTLCGRGDPDDFPGRCRSLVSTVAVDCLTGHLPSNPNLPAAVTRLGATVFGELMVLFQPHGITCVLVLAESHFIVSTWPEHKLVHIDLFTCRADTDPEHALQPVMDALGCVKVHAQRIQRVTPTSFPVTGALP
ncbi:MAG: S-adenosylmethionine decarboxylase family protein [Pseudonocardiaceae bacterium]